MLISRLSNDVEALDTLVSDGIVTLFGSSLTLIGTAVILFTLDAELALLTYIVFPILGIASFGFRIVSADAYRATREKVARSPPTWRRRSPASASCARSPRSRVTSRASPSSTRRTAART